MKISDLLTITKSTYLGAHTYFADLLGHKVAAKKKGAEGKAEAAQQVISDVKFLIANQDVCVVLFDTDGAVHIVRASVNGWLHEIRRVNSKGCTALYPASRALDYMVQMIRDNWEIIH
jgi:hypothetical protein